MKAFKDLVVIKQPLAPMWQTVRDRLPELAVELNDIEAIEILEREELTEGDIRLVNRWRSSQHIPAMLQGSLGSSEVSWLDRNVWDEARHCCEWQIEPSVLPDHIRCAGSTRFEPAMGGRGTRITFEGEFALAPGALKQLAGPLEQPVSKFIESIVTVFIPRNLRKVMQAAGHRVAAED